MIWILIFILFSYVVLILSLAMGFNRVKQFSAEKTISRTNFSIVIPFRNEAENLPKLLDSISKLEYPKELYEVILVNDDSNDSSIEIINCYFKRNQEILNLNYAQPNIKVINNKRFSNSPKKDAIATAIQQSKNNWIITTDADCKLPKKWLQTINAFIEKEQPNMVVGSVNYDVKNSFLHQFQLLDFLSLQGTTIGSFGLQSPFLCNGANLAYKKSVFYKLNGFNGNNNIASGDDIFLFEKFLIHDKTSVKLLKSEDATVTTFPVNSWKELVQQRVRWASKTSNFNLAKVKLIGLLIFSVNASMILSFFAFFFGSMNFTVPFAVFTTKFITDLCLFSPTVSFFKHSKNFIKWYILSSLVYPFFSIWIVFNSLFFKYSWKGRAFMK